uniref:MAM domain-containing protein n=1 Tax=Macrostomum lignano TaxID=282301 RepID=A0A1I8FHZ0_9PLAT
MLIIGQLGGYSAQSASLPSTDDESTSESALHIAKSAIGSNCITFRYWLSSAELSISVRQALEREEAAPDDVVWQQRADDGDDNGWQQGQLMLDAEAGDSAELVIAGSALLSGRRRQRREVADCPTMPPQAPNAVAVPSAVVRFGDIGGFDCDFNDNFFFYYINSNFLAGINVYWANGDTLGEPIFSIFEEKDKRWFEARLNLFGDSTPGQPDINCDFELGKCNYWNQQLQGWSRSSAGSWPIEGTGPQTDHTTGSRNGQLHVVQQFQTVQGCSDPRFNSSGGHCLSFWFHAYGRDVGRSER